MIRNVWIDGYGDASQLSPDIQLKGTPFVIQNPFDWTCSNLYTYLADQPFIKAELSCVYAVVRGGVHVWHNGQMCRRAGYFDNITFPAAEVLYIGQTECLKRRFSNGKHHKHNVFIENDGSPVALPAPCEGTFIYSECLHVKHLEVPVQFLNLVEGVLINHYKPKLNGAFSAYARAGVVDFTLGDLAA